MNRIPHILRYSGIILFVIPYLIVCSILRFGLLIRSWSSIPHDLSIFGSLGLGFCTDVLMACVYAVPLSIVILVAPRKVFQSRLGRFFLHAWFVVAIFLFLFGAVSTWVFWSEFDCRFNFIAVDYLIYTQEVVDNITQSYPMGLIFIGLIAVTAALYSAFVRFSFMKQWLCVLQEPRSIASRLCNVLLVALLPMIGLTCAFVVGKKSSDVDASFMEEITAGLRKMDAANYSYGNMYLSEIVKNSDYSFVAAYFSNDLSWSLYPSMNPQRGMKELPTEAITQLREELSQPSTSFTQEQALNVTRQVSSAQPEKKLNVIQITVESLSFEYLSSRGDAKYGPMKLTPNLDALAKESVNFTNLYACGTRTVRGMEALSLSIPPLPGQSILRRAGNENMCSLPGLFHQKGYDCAFIYGGSGFFDNMNYFFQHNGCRLLDKPAKMAADHPAITFENAWGVCDEDLFDWVLTEADRAYAKQQPFYHFVMTTSNHRPFTWPQGRIDLPCGKAEGGVKYTDYAIGRLIAEAKKRPWFNDTVFVIVADHCAKVAGKQELNVKKYEIPMMFYSPAHFPARDVDVVCSQIDMAPTLLGLMNWNYESQFYGANVLDSTYQRQRAFISNYQKVGMINVMNGDTTLNVLLPGLREKGFTLDRSNGDLLLRSDSTKGEGRTESMKRTIMYYQSADYLFRNRKTSN